MFHSFISTCNLSSLKRSTRKDKSGIRPVYFRFIRLLKSLLTRYKRSFHGFLCSGIGLKTSTLFSSERSSLLVKSADIALT